MSDLIDRLWDRFGSLAYTDLPDDVRTVAGHAVLDWLGCAIAGSREPLADILRAEFAGDAGTSSLIGSTQRADLYRAAMINGAAGHALDFDDTNGFMGGHPSVPLVPAILALAEAERRSATDLLAAYVVGSEVQGHIGAGLGTEHYANGWHQTATMGVFGAAAACAWLLGLDAGGFRAAMSIAASNASGLKANFGTMTKPLHPGQAAERGLMAARLAARGYTADHDAIAGNQGLAQAAGNGSLSAEGMARLDGRWATTATLFKFHAACHLTHAGIEATRSILDGLGADDVERITLTVNPAILDVCGIPEPTTGLEAKFSLTGTQALLLNGVDTAAVETFTDEPIRRPEVQAVIPKVVIETDSGFVSMQTRSRIDTVTGERREAERNVSKPATDLDAQGQALRSKFDALVGATLGTDRADALAARLIQPESVSDVTELMEMTR